MFSPEMKAGACPLLSSGPVQGGGRQDGAQQPGVCLVFRAG